MSTSYFSTAARSVTAKRHSVMPRRLTANARQPWRCRPIIDASMSHSTQPHRADVAFPGYFGDDGGAVGSYPVNRVGTSPRLPSSSFELTSLTVNFARRGNNFTRRLILVPA